tara:strand:+ start:133 stop:600 length:468 start_codon:yes stop_codon:yes gene_type:complete
MQQLIEDSLTYDPDTGLFKWLTITGTKKRGWFVGWKNKRGYCSIEVNGKKLLAHRLAWYLMKGKMPENIIDHIDRNPSNNKLDNLRVSTHRGNTLNSARYDNSKNASQMSNGRWRSYYTYRGKKEHLGVFGTEKEAAEKAQHVKLNYRHRDEQQA